MEFVSTPDEAQSITLSLMDGGFFAGAKVKVEAAVEPDAPWRTTVLANGVGPTVLVESQKNPRYDGAFRDFARWLSANRHYTQLYLATSESDHLSGELMANLKRDGTGLIVVRENGSHEVILEATCPALQATPDPTLRLGKCQPEVNNLVRRFNSGERKGALQDACEAVERETQRLLEKAANKGVVEVTPNTSLPDLKWANRIDILALKDRYPKGGPPLVSPDLKNDLHSFRGARNLVDHPVNNKREAARREQQFTERMMMAPRLLAELIRLQGTIR